MASSADLSMQGIAVLDDRSWSIATIADHSTTGIEVLDPEEASGVGVGSDILIVDDDAGNLVAYQAALEPLGRNLVLVQSGMEAVAKLLDQDRHRSERAGFAHHYVKPMDLKALSILLASIAEDFSKMRD